MSVLAPQMVGYNHRRCCCCRYRDRRKERGWWLLEEHIAADGRSTGLLHYIRLARFGQLGCHTCTVDFGLEVGMRRVPAVGFVGYSIDHFPGRVDQTGNTKMAGRSDGSLRSDLGEL